MSKAKRSRALATRRKPVVRSRKKVSTAMAVRPKAREEAFQPQARVVAADELALGGFGVVREIKLTAREEEILSRPVRPEDIRVKPTKHATPYLPHPVYTKWFNDAFGRTGWALVPVSMPKTLGKSVTQVYVLHVHGAGVAYAMGEQEYHENNDEQTYGDALEATHASALRRCAKHLGVGLEMWDRDFLDEWTRTHCVQVGVKRRDGSVSKVWRRKNDRPVAFETSHGGDAPRRRETAPRQAPPNREPPPEPPAGHHAHAREPITQAQRQRLVTCVRNAGRTDDEMIGWLGRRYGYASTKDIKRDEYDWIVARVEGEGDLPEKVIIPEVVK